jgi:hypothetical protein
MFDIRLLTQAGFAALALCLFASAAQAAEASNVCDFHAFTVDPDPAGINVRGGPGSGAKVLAVLPQSIDANGENFAPEFVVTGFEAGWFQIEHATTSQYGDEPERVLFEGPGWISSKLVSFVIQDPALRAVPSSQAKVVLDMSGADWGPDSVIIDAVHACEGGFVEVTVTTPDGQTATGWANDLCGNQVTTCS